MAAKKKVAISYIVHDTDLPPAAQAASIALTLCKTVKVDTWDEFEKAAADEKNRELLATVRLEPEQAQLITDYPFAVRAVGANAPLRTVIVCDTCGRVLVVSGGSAPKKCSMTPGCEGAVARASAATRKQV